MNRGSLCVNGIPSDPTGRGGSVQFAPSQGSGAAPLLEDLVTNPVWPPRTSDRSAVLHAYESVLGWSLLADGMPVRAKEADRLFGDDPTVVLRTPCAGFDLVSVPYELGLDALVLIERADVRIPCIRRPEEVTFLVRMATGQFLADVDFTRVEAVPDGLLTLPPTAGTRWDTPPWLSSSPEPLPLPEATTLAHGLEKVTRTRRAGLPR